MNARKAKFTAKEVDGKWCVYRPNGSLKADNYKSLKDAQGWASFYNANPVVST